MLRVHTCLGRFWIVQSYLRHYVQSKDLFHSGLQWTLCLDHHSNGFLHQGHLELDEDPMRRCQFCLVLYCLPVPCCIDVLAPHVDCSIINDPCKAFRPHLERDTPLYHKKTLGKFDQNSGFPFSLSLGLFRAESAADVHFRTFKAPKRVLRAFETLNMATAGIGPAHLHHYLVTPKQLKWYFKHVIPRFQAEISESNQDERVWGKAEKRNVLYHFPSKTSPFNIT